MSITADDARQAILRVLSVIAGPAYQQTDHDKPLALQLGLCAERIKQEASEGVALIEACAPHGRAMLSQAQQKLETLTHLAVLHELAAEKFEDL